MRALRNLVWGILLAACGALAAPSFHGEKNYPALGLKMRTLSNSEPAPAPTPQVFSVTFSSPDQESEETRDLMLPREQWFAVQCVGRWMDKDSNLFTLGVPTSQMVDDKDGFPVQMHEKGKKKAKTQRLMSREMFDAAYARARASFAEEKETSAEVKWLADFADSEPAGEAQPVKLSFSPVKRAIYVPLAEKKKLAWIFELKSGSSRYGCVLEVRDGTPLAKARKNFETQFLPHLAPLPAALTQSARAKAEAERAEAAKPILTDAADVKKTAIASIANMKGWWHDEAEGYVFLSDIRSSDGKRLIRTLRERLPALRRKMNELVPCAGKTNDVNVVRIFEDKESYARYLGKKKEWSAGCWVPMRRELLVLWQNDRSSKGEETLRIVRHEGFHQYLFYALPKVQTSMWYNEGHACYFENAKVSSRGEVKISASDDAWRKRFLKQHLATAVSKLPSILDMDHEKFYAGTDDDRALNYSVAWGIIHYLRDEGKVPAAYSKILARYREEILRSGDEAAATSFAFDGINLRSFASAFGKYWSKAK